MTIRFAQMQVLQTAQKAATMERLLAHVRRHFPACASSPGWESAATETVRHARATYGLRAERDLYAFIDLCCAFGWDFDTRSENAWMAAVLRDTAVTRPGDRVHRLVRLCLSGEAVARENQAARETFLAAAT